MIDSISQIPTGAYAVFKAGGIIAYPTESCIGLGCDPTNQQAVTHLLALKSRHADKGLILVADRPDRFDAYIEWPDTDIKTRIFDSWPGPVTWLLPARNTTPSFLRGKSRLLAIRVPDHPVVSDLCQKLGSAIVSTSANPTGRPAAKSEEALTAYFGEQIDCVVEGKIGTSDRPSRIINAINGCVVRE